jgi:hypothetical protein
MSERDWKHLLMCFAYWRERVRMERNLSGMLFS